MKHTATRFHDFSYGHSVYGHESVCSRIHGHNGRVHFTVQAEVLDGVGRVLDFGDIGKRLCQWIERSWDHRFLIWQDDPRALSLKAIDVTVELVPFNPTAENLAQYLLAEVGPVVLAGSGAVLVAVRFDETRKCSATASCSFQEASQHQTVASEIAA